MSDSEETANKTQTPAPSATAGTQSTNSAGQTTPTNNLDSLFAIAGGANSGSPRSALTDQNTTATVTVKSVVNSVAFTKYLLEEVDPSTVAKLDANFKLSRNLGHTNPFTEFIDEKAGRTIDRQFKSLNILNHEQWRQMDPKTFFVHLTRAFESTGDHTIGNLLEQSIHYITGLKFNFIPTNPGSWSKYISDIDEFLVKHGAKTSLSDTDQASLVKNSLDTLKHAKPTSIYAPCVDAMRGFLKINIRTMPDMDSYLQSLTDECNEVSRLYCGYHKYKLPGQFLSTQDQLARETVNTGKLSNSAYKRTIPGDNQDSFNDNKRSRQDQQNIDTSGDQTTDSNQSNSGGQTNYPTCNGCGKTHKQPCTLRSHPDFNNSSLSWTESEPGIAWAKRGKATLPTWQVLDEQANSSWKKHLASQRKSK